MKKSIYTLFLLFLCIFSCFFVDLASNSPNFALADNLEVEENIKQQNAFRIIRQADESGKIALSYIFPVNSKLLEEKDFSEGEIKTYRFYLSTFVAALAKQNKDKGVEGVSVSGCTYFTDVDGLGFSVVFEDAAAQKRFFGVDEGGENDKENAPNTKSSGFFMKKLNLCTTFPVSSKKSAEDLKAICSMAISSWCKDNNISDERKNAALANLEDSVFIYDFATTQEGLKSDLMYDDENFHHNVFIKNAAQIEAGDNQITFFTTYPNTPVWYATALVIVLAAMSVAYVILSRKKKQNH